MTVPDHAPPSDALAEAAALIRDVGLSAECARRYRALAATIADPTFDRTLALGSAVRRAGRDQGRSNDIVGTAIQELRELLARSDAAIAEVRASARYREAAAWYTAGAAERVAPLAAEIFTDVIAAGASDRLSWEVPIGAGPGGEHFVSPEECAARLATLGAEGIPAAAPPNLGGDDTIKPVALGTAFGAVEGPVTLVFEPHLVPAPVCRLEHGTLALFYAERLRAPFTVHCTGTVTDEWWSIRPDAYAIWLETLTLLLRAQGLAVTISD